VIRAGKLWTGADGPVLRDDVDIVVRDGRIESVGPHRPRGAYPAGTGHVDSSGQTVIPGLWDAHAHVQLDQPHVGARRPLLQLALGITSVVSMGDPAYLAINESEAQRSGALVGPRLFRGSEPLDGSRVFWGFMRATPDAQTLTRELDRLAALRPAIVKTYVRLPNDLQAAAIAAGHRIGRPSFSHFLWPALPSGQDATAHWAIQALIYSLVQDQANHTYADVVTLYAQSGMAVTATPFIGNYVQDFPGLLTDPRMTTLLTPQQYSVLRQEFTTPLLPVLAQYTQATTEGTAQVLRAGGTVMIGADAPIGIGPYGAQIAFEILARYGLTPFEILRCATAEPAKVMGVAGDLGTVEPGKVADLVFLDSDPLADIANTLRVTAVMQDGVLRTQHEILAPFAAPASGRMRLPRGLAISGLGSDAAPAAGGHARRH